MLPNLCVIKLIICQHQDTIIMFGRCGVQDVLLRWLRRNYVSKPCAIDRSRAVDVSWYQEHYSTPNSGGDIAKWNLIKLDKSLQGRNARIAGIVTSGMYGSSLAHQRVSRLWSTSDRQAWPRRSVPGRIWDILTETIFLQVSKKERQNWVPEPADTIP